MMCYHNACENHVQQYTNAVKSPVGLPTRRR